MMKNWLKVSHSPAFSVTLFSVCCCSFLLSSSPYTEPHFYISSLLTWEMSTLCINTLCRGSHSCSYGTFTCTCMCAVLYCIRCSFLNCTITSSLCTLCACTFTTSVRKPIHILMFMCVCAFFLYPSCMCVWLQCLWYVQGNVLPMHLLPTILTTPNRTRHTLILASPPII